jgi:hypothetical protein
MASAAGLWRLETQFGHRPREAVVEQPREARAEWRRHSKAPFFEFHAKYAREQ